MAAKKKKTFVEMADDELARELESITKALFNLRVRKVTDVVENPASFKANRRDIARIRTEQRAREIRKLEAAAKAPKPAAVATAPKK